MNRLWRFVPPFLTRLISNYSFQKKFLHGSLVISIPVLIASILAYALIDIEIVQLLLVFFTLGLFVVLYLFFGAVYISVMDTISELQKITEKWKEGDLSARIDVKTNDELKDIALAFNEVTTAFEEEIDEHKAIRYVIEQALQKNNQLISAIDNLEIGVIITEASKDGNPVIYVNPGFEKITGYPEAEVIGHNLSILQGEETAIEDSKMIIEAIQEKKQISLEILNYHKSGRTFWNYLSITPVYNEENQLVNFIGIMTDITKQKKADEKIYELAYFDPLTKLSNINSMKEYVNHQLAKGISSYAIFYIDIDRFKNLNSNLGFKVGDIVLNQFAERLLRATEKSGGLLARASKDEYVYFISNINERNDLISISDKIIKYVSEPFTINLYEFYLGTSIGISLYPKDSSNLEQLIQHAETAMNEAKISSIKKLIFYEPSMSMVYKETHELENQLKFAIERNELRLVYQPKICISTGEIVGAEALVRWEHPTDGMISPMKFIPIAESTGLIFGLGAWVLEHACQKRKEWLEKGLGEFKLSVNLSAKQFNEGYFIPTIEETLEKIKLDPKYLEIELTESALHDETNAITLLHYLKSKNIAVSIDDFGTGYSSLNYLRVLPINTLKIDRSFIIEMETSEKGSKLLESIIKMGHSLDLNVIAEGVETKLQLLMIKEMGCNEIQGYFVSKPLNEADFIKFIKEYSPNIILENYQKV